MHAGLATALFALVGDVVVDEGGRLEVLDCRSRGEGARGVPSHGLAAKQYQSGSRALAARAREARKGVIQVAREVVASERLVGQGRWRMPDEVRFDGRALLGKVCREGAAIVAAW